jgi:hypothetical protein
MVGVRELLLHYTLLFCCSPALCSVTGAAAALFHHLTSYALSYCTLTAIGSVTKHS